MHDSPVVYDDSRLVTPSLLPRPPTKEQTASPPPSFLLFKILLTPLSTSSFLYSLHKPYCTLKTLSGESHHQLPISGTEAFYFVFLSIFVVNLLRMAEAVDDSIDIEKLYEYGERLTEAKDKSQVSFLSLSLLVSRYFISFEF